MTLDLTPLQFGVPGGMELAVILLIAILLFGANKIPKLARSTGQALGEFQRGRQEIEQELEELEETATLDDGGASGAAETSTASTDSAETADPGSAQSTESTESADTDEGK